MDNTVHLVETRKIGRQELLLDSQLNINVVLYKNTSCIFVSLMAVPAIVLGCSWRTASLLLVTPTVFSGSSVLQKYTCSAKLQLLQQFCKNNLGRIV